MVPNWRLVFEAHHGTDYFCWKSSPTTALGCHGFAAFSSLPDILGVCMTVDTFLFGLACCAELSGLAAGELLE